MDFRILGPLEVDSEVGAIDVPGTKPRAVLAVLLLHANQPVSPERIAQALWGEDAPAGAVRTVQVHISRLRKALGNGEVLTTTPAGYRLCVQPGELDAERFDRLVEDGRRALANGEAERAGDLLREALGLWRGEPLADLAFEPFAQVEIARLEELHQTAIEARFDADLAAGRHAELVAELRRMVSRYPSRERLAAQLMTALYRSGRQSEALDAYREARQRLATEVGVEPGDELRSLQQAILHHDAALMLAPPEALPHELEAAASPPLIGRETELAWLRERWDEARSGRGRLIAIAGAQGMGKTRLAAELAIEVHAHGGTVLYASGTRPARAVHDVLDRSRSARPPVLLIVDDADQASDDVLAAVREAAGGSTLVLATATAHEALEGLEPGVVLFLDLDRLGPAAVAKIAALYVPDQASDALPAEWILGASAGVPQRIHDVASQWAKERVTTVADKAAAGRSQLRSMEDELAGGVVQLQTVREWRETAGDGEERVVCPFKGLASFEADDAPYFFGRERLVAELVARLVGAPLLAAVGPSGSGKSSVVKAGLLPALRNGVLPGSEKWLQRAIRPGEQPRSQLRKALAGVEDRRFVLVVDQFEEAFTLCRDEDERAAFVTELVRAAGGESGGVVVLALRSDFYGRCAEFPQLSRLLASNHVLVGQMQRDELRRAITCPAQRVGLTVDDDLAEAIVDDVADAPGALPLMSTALLELWRHRQGRRLRLASYERTGGVRGAVARLGEEALAELDADQQAVARDVLLQLVKLDKDGAVERRRRRLDELDSGEDVGRVLEVLSDRRLVTLSDDTAELAHEALLREWPRLREWIGEILDDLRVEQSLSAAADDWKELDEDDDSLYRGARLAAARDWAERGKPSLTEVQREFLQASIDRDRRVRAAGRRRLRIAFAALILGLAAIAVVAAVALDQRAEAERQRDVAASRALALESQKAAPDDPELAVRLALWALDTAETDEAGAALREATAAYRERGSVTADSANVWTASISRDGTRLVTGGDDGRVILWDATTHQEIGSWAAGHGQVSTSRFAADGERVALGFEDGTVIVTDAALGSRRTIERVADQRVWSVAFTREGERVAAAFADGTVRLIAVDGTEPAQVLSGHEGQVLGVDISADGSRVASAGEDGTVRLWNTAESGSEILHDEAGTKWDVALSPDGNLVLAVGDDGSIRRWDARTGREGARTPGGGDELYTVSFSADGRRFAAGGEDGLVRVWALDGRSPVAVMRGQSSRVWDVAFGPESHRVISAGDDGTVRFWDAGTAEAWTVPGDARSMDFAPDGRLIASSSDDGKARVWDSSTGRLEAELPGAPSYMTARFTPSGEALTVTSDVAPAVRLWPMSANSAELLFRAPDGDGLWSAELDPSGERVVYADVNGRIAVRTLDERGAEMTLRGGPEAPLMAQFSPDGKRVAVIQEADDVTVWRVDRPEEPERVLRGHSGHQNWMQYGADGRLVTAGGDRTVRVWPAQSTRSVVMTGHTEEVSGAAFSVDGAKVVSTGMDGTLRLWDSRTGVLLGTLETGPNELHNVVMSRDGRIAVLDETGTVRVFRCDVCGTLDEVRALAESLDPRQLTPEERSRFAAAAG